MGKAYSSYTFKDMKKSGLSFLQRDKPDEAASEQAQAFKYILRSARLMDLDINEWSVLTHFGNTDHETYPTTSIHTDKKVLRKLMHESVSALGLASAASTGLVATPSDSTLEMLLNTRVNLSKLIAGSLASRLKQATDRVATQTGNTKARYNAYMTALRALGEYNLRAKELTMLQESDVDDDSLYKQVRAVCANPTYKFIGSRTSDVRYSSASVRLDFITTKDCVVRHYMADAGVDQEVNFGRYRVSVHVTPNGIYDVRVYAHYGNVLCARYTSSSSAKYYHPHISREGYICWGDYDDRVRDMLVDGKLADIMVKLETLLWSYTAENPYVSFDDFYKAYSADGFVYSSNLTHSSLESYYDLSKLSADQGMNYTEMYTEELAEYTALRPTEPIQPIQPTTPMSMIWCCENSACQYSTHPSLSAITVYKTLNSTGDINGYFCSHDCAQEIKGRPADVVPLYALSTLSTSDTRRSESQQCRWCGDVFMYLEGFRNFCCREHSIKYDEALTNIITDRHTGRTETVTILDESYYLPIPEEALLVGVPDTHPDWNVVNEREREAYRDTDDIPF